MNSYGAVALIGAGAIGLPLAAAMADRGRQVIVCGRDSIEEIEITRAGASKSWPVKHAVTPEEVPQVEYIIVAVKAHQSDTVAPWLHACAGDGVKILAAQNGIEHEERLGPFARGAAVIPSVLFFNNERIGPGKALMRRVTDNYIAMPDSAASRGLAAELSAGGIDVSVESDFKTVAWTKFLINLTASPLTALTDRDAEVMRDPGIAALARSIMVEAVKVGIAEGAALTDLSVERALQWAKSVEPGTTTSMREDRTMGRVLEHDAFTGAVIRAAERHGIDVPVNRMIFALVDAIRPGGGAGEAILRKCNDVPENFPNLCRHLSDEKSAPLRWLRGGGLKV